jgi:hypothetical protein
MKMLEDDEIAALWIEAVRLRKDANALQKRADYVWKASEQAWQKYLTAASIGWWKR